ncbi:P27 family phage terminase small subunit [Paenarthrobacter sp. NPDC089714]|uniref:P27 family phage terminase small subunit n=1 Tax=Paenarthrobacter sp. NPDC089714 TaxID=3364377 RepID=UPI003830353A
MPETTKKTTTAARGRRGSAAAEAPAEESRAFPPPERLDSAASEVWREIIEQHHEPAKIVGPDLEAYCAQVALQRDLRARIAGEGSIIADERGRPEPHPAIALERAAQKEIRDWGDKFRGRAKRPTPTRRTS